MIIDILYAAVLGYGLYVGFSNGIVKTIFTVLSIAIGILVMAHFYEQTTELLKDLFNYHNSMMIFAGMFVTFFVTMLILRLIGRQIENILKVAKINFVNQILGGVVMAGLFTVVFSIIVWFLVEARVLNDHADSKTYPILKEVPGKAKIAWAKVSPAVTDLWHNMAKALDQVGNSTETINIDDLGGKEFEIKDLSGDEDTSN